MTRDDLLKLIQGSGQGSPAAATADQANSNILWAPDHSSWIDASKNPGAKWVPFNSGSGSFDGPSNVPAGWEVDGQRVADGFGDGGTGEQTGVLSAKPKHQVLKELGLWNFQDPNFIKHLNALGGGDVMKDPQAMYKATGQLYAGDILNPGKISRHHGSGQTMHADLVAAGFSPEYADSQVESKRAYAEKASKSDDNLFSPKAIIGGLTEFAGELFNTSGPGFVLLPAAMMFGANAMGWLPGIEATITAPAVPVGAGGAMDMGVGLGEVAGGFGVGPEAGLVGAEMTAGVSTDPNKFLLAEGPSSTMTDVSGGLLDGPASGMPPAVHAEGAFNASAFPGGGTEFTSVLTPSSPGIIDSVLAWGKENPLLASAALQLGGGVIAGIGNNITANQVMDKRIAGEKELQDMKLQQEKDLAEWKRKFTQAGSYFDANVPFKPAQNRQLRRPDGSLVYGPSGGIIAGNMTG